MTFLTVAEFASAFIVSLIVLKLVGLHALKVRAEIGILGAQAENLAAGTKNLGLQAEQSVVNFAAQVEQKAQARAREIIAATKAAEKVGQVDVNKAVARIEVAGAAVVKDVEKAI